MNTIHTNKTYSQRVPTSRVRQKCLKSKQIIQISDTNLQICV